MWVDYEVTVRPIGSYSGRVEVANDATDYEIEEKIKEELDFTIDIYRWNLTKFNLYRKDDSTMIDLSNKYFLMIEPDKLGIPSDNPTEDEITNKVDFIFSKCINPNYSYRGAHRTKCGKFSDNNDWILPNGMTTNSLCTYYVRYYRLFIPESEIEKINKVYEEINKMI